MYEFDDICRGGDLSTPLILSSASTSTTKGRRHRHNHSHPSAVAALEIPNSAAQL